jgi:hypothetical protein
LVLRDCVWVGGEAVVDPGALSTGLDHTRIAKHRQVPGGRRLRNLKGPLDVTNAQLAVRKQSDDPEAGLVTQGIVEAGKRSKIKGGHVYSNIRM